MSIALVQNDGNASLIVATSFSQAFSSNKFLEILSNYGSVLPTKRGASVFVHVNNHDSGHARKAVADFLRLWDPKN